MKKKNESDIKDQKKIEKKKTYAISRREFVETAAASMALFTIVPSHVLGGMGRISPSDKLNIAGIGVGGKGYGDLLMLSEGSNIVALCDVDQNYAANTFKKFPNAKQHTDYRRMLEKQKDIDAVMIATPDHHHAAAALCAIWEGKHVFCEKPLGHSIYEVRKMTEEARKSKVVTQMGIQHHAGEGIRQCTEWVNYGAIGKVHEVHVWANGGGGGGKRPADVMEIPAGLDWDLWLGPAPDRPYNQAYHPKKWRGWWDFGGGSLGDMGCHVIDLPYYALKLGAPLSVEAFCEGSSDEQPPKSGRVVWEFAARGDMPPVKMIWYDSYTMVTRPPELAPDEKIGGVYDCGGMLVGDKGKMLTPHYEDARLLPTSRTEEFKRKPKILPRIEGGIKGHYRQWVDACKGGPPTEAPFEYGGPLTEIVLLGCVAMRTGSGQKLYWDSENMKVTNNVPDAKKYIEPEFRKGYKL